MPLLPRSVKSMSRKTNPTELQLCELDKDICRQLVIDNHYSGRCPGIKYCFGILESGVVVGGVVFSIPASYTLCKGVCGDTESKLVIELARLVITTPSKNAASFLVGRSLAALPDHIVVSYADCNLHIGHVGYVYQATNWLYTGQGNAEPVWCHPTTGEVISYTRRHIDDKAKEHGLLWTDLTRRKQVGKHRYVTFTGSKKFKRRVSQLLRYTVKPYPKGETHRHQPAVMQVAEKPIEVKTYGTAPPIKVVKRS